MKRVLQVAALAAVSLQIIKMQKQRERKTWTDGFFIRIPEQGTHENLVQKLTFNAPDDYRSFLRMDVENIFSQPLSLVEPLLKTKDTVMGAAERLAVTLQFTDSFPFTESASTSESETSQRLDRDHLFLLLAWWMEMSPQARVPKSTCCGEKQEKLNKVGVVIKRPDGTFLDADCTREDMHPAIRLIIKHGKDIEGCDMFMSRLPCAKCSKHIVQAKLNRVVYLDLDSELDDKEDRKHVHNHFLRSLPLVKMVPEIPASYEFQTDEPPADNPIMAYKLAKEEEAPKGTDDTRPQMEEGFKKAQLWLYDNTYLRTSYDDHTDGGPTDERKLIIHAMRMADILSTRADDPQEVKVGAVLLGKCSKSEDNKHMCVIGAGWNGYPRGAVKYNYPLRKEEKLKSVIHAECNALLYRFQTTVLPNLAVVTKRPCEDCFQSLKLFGVKDVYFKEEKKAKGKVWMKYHYWSEPNPSVAGHRYKNGQFTEVKNENVDGQRDL